MHVHIFLSSALAGSEWSASRPNRFSRENNRCTNFIGGWKSPVAPVFMMQRISLTVPGLELRPIGSPTRSRLRSPGTRSYDMYPLSGL
jgi:hypothetical protein